MKKALLLLAITIIGCSKDTIEFTPVEQHTISFKMQAASETSKVPVCKDTGEPNMVFYSMTNANNQEAIYVTSVEKENNVYVTNDPKEIIDGDYTLNSIELTDGNEVYYSVLTTENPEYFQFSNFILPVDITVDKDLEINSPVFCYVPSEAPDVPNIIEGGFVPNRLGSLWIYVRDSGCTQSVWIAIDALVIEKIIAQPGIIEVAIPDTGFYDTLSIWTENGRGELLEGGANFTNENPYDVNTLIVIDNDCN